jgi:hypothetical protein
VNGYVTQSRLASAADGHHLDLATAPGVTPQGPVANPVFFTGFLIRPDVASSGLLAVADVAASRYADAGLATRLANLDPVVTAGGDRLRFESFSACNGVYARFDLLQEGLGSGEVGFGTTNVDINLPLRTALARVDRAEPVHLSVGKDELRASSLSGTHVQRKVNLPERWIRGLAEVPELTRSMTRVGELAAPALSRFLGALPRVAAPGPSLHILPSRAGWRVSRRPLPGAVPLPGASRLRGSDRIIRHASRLTVHLAPNGTTAWVFEVFGGRFTLVLSPDPFRGFSGEGTLLTLLTHSDAEVHGRHLLRELAWSPVVDEADLARRTDMSASDVATGLAWLSASGRLGYDVVDQAWFHRELPVDSDRVLRRNPRLVAARALVSEGAVEPSGDSWRVRGSHGGVYSVTSQLRCGCAWEAEHAGGRGPCKHILAVLISSRD